MKRAAARLFFVEHDKEGIRLAALEMLNESLYVEQRERTQRVLAQSADPGELLERTAPKRAFACGYYMWVGYLFRLEAAISAGLRGELTAADFVGLLALREARAQFEDDHPPCRCGRRKKNGWDQTCGECKEAV